MANVKINSTNNNVNVTSTDQAVTVTNNNTGTSVSVTHTNTGLVTVSSPGPAGPTGAPGSDGTAGDFTNLSNVPFLYSSSLQTFTNITASGDISASAYYGDGSNLTGVDANPFTHVTASGNISASGTLTIGAGTSTIGGLLTGMTSIVAPTANVNFYDATLNGSLNLAGHITASGNISASGDLISKDLYLDQKIYHASNTITYLNFTKNRLRFNVGGISYIDLNDETGPPRDITFNDGGNNVDLTIKGSSNNPLFKTDASANRIGTHGKGTPQAAFHIGGDELRVDGNISASGFISGSTIIGPTGSFEYISTNQYIAHEGDENTRINFTDNKIKFEAGGMSFLSLYDDDSAPFTATVNNDSNRINFKVMDKNNDLLLKTDSDAYNVLLHHAGNEKLSTQAFGINVTGGISASGHISSSGKVFAADGFYHSKDVDQETYIGFPTGDKIYAVAGGVNFMYAWQKDADVNKLIFNEDNTDTDIIFRSANGSNNKLLYLDASADKIGIKTGFPTEALTVEGNISASGYISGSTIWGATGSFSRVGIATATPGYALDMGAQTIGNWNALASQGNLYFDNGGYIDSRGSGDLTFRTTDSITTRMVIKNNGLVGIGTSDPAANLHLEGDEPEFFIKHTGTAGDDKTTITWGDKHGQAHAKLFTQLKNDTNGSAYDSEFHIQTAVDGTLADRIVVEEQGYVTVPSNNVGIGTTTPTEKLQVEGNISASGNISSSLAVIGTTGSFNRLETIGKLSLPQDNAITNPTLNFGDGDSGFYEAADDVIRVAINGGYSYAFHSAAITGNASNRFAIQLVTPTSTLPTFTPNYTDSDTGIGYSRADVLSLIAGGVGVEVTSTGISGSLISTGSFGQIKSSKIIESGTGVGIGITPDMPFIVNVGTDENLRVRSDGGVQLTARTDNNGSDVAMKLRSSAFTFQQGNVYVENGNISGSITSTGSFGSLKIDGSSVDFTNLPTSDPGVAGRLWNDSNTVKISAG